MNKILVVGLLLIAVVVGAWWFYLRGTDVAVSWSPDWPESVRGVGEATERIVASPDGEITEGDRARAVERARWKAYYYAQLRLAEQLGGLRIDATTVVRDMDLADQELKAVFSDTVNAAREVESEGTIEDLGDTVRATVVVEAPPEKLANLGALVAALVKSGRISLIKKTEIAEGPEDDDAEDIRTEPEDETVAPDSREPVGRPPSASGSAPQPMPAAPQHTGCTVLLDGSSDFVGVVPDFYDGAGTLLGSSLNLPAKRRTAGIVLATSYDTALIEENAGARPKSFRGTVSKGNVILDSVLDSNEAMFFQQWLRAGKVVLVLGEEG